MNLIIVGAGQVGETLVEKFVNENHDIVVLDVDKEKVNRLVNKYDIQGVVGSCVERQALVNAGIETADFLMACTSRDEVNILCSVLGRKLGAKRTIARVRDPEYFKEMGNMREDLGLDYFFNPELRAAVEIAEILKFPSAKNVESFAGGKARMVELDISSEKRVKAYVYDKLAVKTDYDMLLSNIENGRLHLVLEKLFEDGIERGTITFEEDGTASFQPAI
jgi:trk system potassium uptake protein TrkA